MFVKPQIFSTAVDDVGTDVAHTGPTDFPTLYCVSESSVHFKIDEMNYFLIIKATSYIESVQSFHQIRIVNLVSISMQNIVGLIG